MSYIEIARLVIGAIILAYASYTDIKTREASNLLWISMAVIGFIFLFSYKSYDFFKIIFSILISFLVGILLYFSGMGGADVKAIWAISLLRPVSDEIFFIFPISVLINSLFLVLPLPLIFFVYNILNKNFEFPYCLFGYKMRANVAKNSFVWAMEKNGKKSINPQKDVDLSLLGEKEIWVTPQLPFLLFIFFGYITSFIFGNFLFLIFSFFK
ncbi:MAG: prepilin peptidase [Thermoplasmatales archaeon]|nr:prepilin peptidase [Thermoplasmatales archaeon]